MMVSIFVTKKEFGQLLALVEFSIPSLKCPFNGVDEKQIKILQAKKVIEL